MIIDNISNRALYYFLGEDFRKALDFFAAASVKPLEKKDISLPESSVIIKARPMSTKPEEECFFEAHRKYADIHFVCRGQERIGYADVHTLTEISYSAESDTAKLEGKGDFVTLREGCFMITLPSDAHMPGVCVSEPAPLGKMIAKIKL